LGHVEKPIPAKSNGIGKSNEENFLGTMILSRKVLSRTNGKCIMFNKWTEAREGTTIDAINEN
jgi:hypothetical protein